MPSEDRFLVLFIVISLGLVTAGLAIVHLIGWLSARTLPATIVILPRSPLPSSPPGTSDWRVTEVLAGDRLEMVHQNREIVVKLACITVKPDPVSTRHAGDRLRGLTLVGDPTFRVTELGVEADGSVLAELWVTRYGNAPQLAQVVLAGGGYVSVSPRAADFCPNASSMMEAQRYAEQRRRPPRIIHF